VCKECGPNPNHDTDACWVLKRKAREAREKADKAPYSRRTFRKEVNAMARRAVKNDGLKIFESAVKREQAKLAKKAGRTNKKSTKKSRGKKDESDSDTSSDESMHNMEARIPRKKSYRKKVKNVRYNSKAQIVAVEPSSDEDSSSDEMEMESSDDETTNQASAEERAFLKAIQKEEQKATKGSDNSE
jgi:membrane carboxypeptidase/penicillin-binding protein